MYMDKIRLEKIKIRQCGIWQYIAKFNNINQGVMTTTELKVFYFYSKIQNQ